jgi:hypothetical protein
MFWNRKIIFKNFLILFSQSPKCCQYCLWLVSKGCKDRERGMIFLYYFEDLFLLLTPYALLACFITEMITLISSQPPLLLLITARTMLIITPITTNFKTVLLLLYAATMAPSLQSGLLPLPYLAINRYTPWQNILPLKCAYKDRMQLVPDSVFAFPPFGLF